MEFTDPRIQELEGKLSEADIINHQLQMTLSEAQMQQANLRRQLEVRSDELRKSEEKHRLLRIEFDQLHDEYQNILEGDYGAGGISRSKNLRGSVAIVTGYVDKDDRWVQTSDDLLPIPEHVLDELEGLRAEVVSLQRALDRAARSARNSLQHSRSNSYDSTDSGDLRSDYGGAEPSHTTFVPPPPLNLARQLVMPPAIQSSAMLQEEPSFYPDDTPRNATLTGRLRADQPLNLTKALSLQSQRQLTSRRYLATPRDSARVAVPPLRVGEGSGFHLAAAMSTSTSMMSPRLTHLAQKYAAATPRLPLSTRASITNRPHRGLSLNADDDDNDVPALASTGECNESLEPIDPPTSNNAKHVDAVPEHSEPATAEIEAPSPSTIEATSPSPSATAATPVKEEVIFVAEVTAPTSVAPPPSKPGNLSLASAPHDDDDYGGHEGRTTRRFHADIFGNGDHDSPKRRNNADALFSLSLEDPKGGATCSICELTQYIKEHFTRMTCRQAYFAAGFIPEMCERWQLEHDIVWTIEERAAIATALHAKPQLSSFSTWHLASAAKYWRHKEQRFWKSNWKDCFLLLQGVFLYVFPSARTTDRLISVSLIRSAKITVQRSTQDKLFVLRLDCLGCGACVGAKEDEHVQEVLIGFKEEHTLLEWKETVSQLSMTCPHMCSSKFANSVTTLREMCEDLLLMSYREEKRAARKLEKHQHIQITAPPEASPVPDPAGVKVDNAAVEAFEAR